MDFWWPDKGSYGVLFFSMVGASTLARTNFKRQHINSKIPLHGTNETTIYRIEQVNLHQSRRAFAFQFYKKIPIQQSDNEKHLSTREKKMAGVEGLRPDKQMYPTNKTNWHV